MKKLTYDQELQNFLSDLGSEREGGSFLAADGKDFGRQDTIDKIHEQLNNINWKSESQYHNTYYLGNGKYGYRELKENKHGK